MHTTRAFTLIETLIYIGLFGVLSVGILSTAYPLHRSAELRRSSAHTESEVLFIFAKINYALAQGATTKSDVELITPHITNPSGESALILGTKFKFELQGTKLMYSENNQNLFPLHGSRIHITNFLVKHIPLSSTSYIEISFEANGIPIGPMHYYLHF